LGKDEIAEALKGHPPGLLIGRGAPVPSNAAALNQPLMVFQTEAHRGPLGRMLATGGLSDSQGQVAIRAFKKAEDSDAFVLRVQNLRVGPPPST
jgi:alpha-mannosidase